MLNRKKFKRSGVCVILFALLFNTLASNNILAYNEFFSGNDILFYDGVECPDYDGSKISVNIPDQPGGVEIRSTGRTAPYIVEDFIIEVLKSIAIKMGVPESDVLTEEHIIALTGFAFGEAGDIKNKSVFNLFNSNTFHSKPELAALYIDGKPSNVGLQAYKSFDIGVEATAISMVTNSYQSRLISVLTQKDSTAEQFVETLTYYKKYEGNKSWSEFADDDPDGYYQIELVLINDARRDYTSRAGLVIGTPAEEYSTTGPSIYRKDLVKYSISGDTSSDSSSMASYIDPCGPGGHLASGGMTSVAQVQEFNKIYKNLTDDEIDNVYKINRAGCTGGPLANCVAYSQYFINRYTTKQYMNVNDGKYVVGDLLALGFTDGGTMPKPYAIFSSNTSEHGHTGVVLGIDAGNNKIYIGHMGCNYTMDEFDTAAKIEKNLSDYTNTIYKYAYTDGFLKEGL